MTSPTQKITSLRRLLFLRALAETDEPGLFLDKLFLARATSQARRQKLPQERLEAFTQLLETDLNDNKHLNLQTFLRSHPALFPALLGLCFLIGASSNYLGPSTRVNLLLNPIILLFFWNFAVYLLLLLPSSWDLYSLLGRPFTALIRRLAGRSYIPTGPWDSDPAGRDILLKAGIRFQKLWWHEADSMLRPLIFARIHLAAIALVCGAIAGLYLRGLVQAYEFTWSSTFIQDEATLKQILGFFYGPVLFVFRTLFPEGLPAIRPDQGARWIHLLALASLVYIILPRLLLATGSYRKLIKARNSLKPNLNFPLIRELLQDHENRRTGFFFYSFSPSEEVLKRLVNSLRKLWGTGLQFEAPKHLEWGEVTLPLTGWEPGSIWVLTFNGVQTPESDVHGEFVGNMKKQALAGKIKLLIVVDAARVASENQDRRQLAWEQVLGPSEPYLWINLNRAEEGQLTEALNQSAWSHGP